MGLLQDPLDRRTNLFHTTFASGPAPAAPAPNAVESSAFFNSLLGQATLASRYQSVSASRGHGAATLLVARELRKRNSSA